jgi:hypothetical protein
MLGVRNVCSTVQMLVAEHGFERVEIGIGAQHEDAVETSGRRSLSPPADSPGSEGGECAPSQRPLQHNEPGLPGATSVAATSVMGNSIVSPPRLRVRRHGSSAATAYAQARFTNLKQQAEAAHQTANAAKKKPQTRPVPDGCSAIAPIALRLWYCRRGKGRYCPSGNVCWTVPAAVAGIENGDERLL